MARTDLVAAELALALELADLADAVSLRHFRRASLVVESKADRSPVSEADREVEQVLRRRLAEARPGHTVHGEEYGQTTGTAGATAGAAGSRGQTTGTAGATAGAAGSRGQTTGTVGATTGAARPRWILDPIDGTRKYVRGMPGWATLIALEDAGEMTVGVASAPALGRRWWAARGLGAFADGQPIHVSSVPTLAAAHVTHGALEGWVRAGRAPQLGALAEQSWGTSGYGDFWIHMLVAEGAAEAAVEIETAIWDLAALKVIVEEAGGQFTDLNGAPTATSGNGVSTNGLVHDAVLALLK